MPPPPATPASSSKFLLSKRQPTQSQQHITPSQTTGGPRQFTATPRFSVSSTPRAAPSQAAQLSTPAILPPRGTSARGRATQDLIDIESSPEPSDAESPSGKERHDGQSQDDLIASFTSESPSEEQGQGGRSPKRRRISVSPVWESSPPHAVHSDTLPERLDIDIEPSFQSSDAEEEYRNSPDSKSLLEPNPRHKNKPTKPSNRPLSSNSRLPQSLLSHNILYQTPFRRNVAGLRTGGDGSEITAAAGNKGLAPEAPSTEGGILVEEVRRGTGFWLVSGRDSEGDDIRTILAGEGRLSGLAERKNSVVSGCIVATLPPMWDVELDGQRWKVVCDWYVASHGG
ncbi:hypothetical protein NKR19_g8197 [Coniochaeta hoffmannii]|uniref:Uncharacterized protein n=1 Tax=Coniochaeta hoffmannii TaxID=91930 RepID=A0AA38VF27_9PEZI|nr:hypothetical protein NKR19_g8197 [Coniochaeta hoffmannii]